MGLKPAVRKAHARGCSRAFRGTCSAHRVCARVRSRQLSSAAPIPFPRMFGNDRDQQQFLFARRRAHSVKPAAAASPRAPHRRDRQAGSACAGKRSESPTCRRVHASPHAGVERGVHHRHDPVEIVASCRQPRVGRAAVDRRDRAVSSAGGRSRAARASGSSSSTCVALSELLAEAAACLPAIEVAGTARSRGLRGQRGQRHGFDRTGGDSPATNHSPWPPRHAYGDRARPRLFERHRRDQRQRRIARNFGVQASRARCAAARPIRTPVKLPGPSDTRIRPARPRSGSAAIIGTSSSA